ncbi:MAG: hypothetical protein EXX96DRAFT_612238 [Benjaminiella poitrasii]|nr:MAG: hypothetical protein EXX96DRAFT_612238 [Benjaminiella poitrasii]
MSNFFPERKLPMKLQLANKFKKKLSKLWRSNRNIFSKSIDNNALFTIKCFSKQTSLKLHANFRCASSPFNLKHKQDKQAFAVKWYRKICSIVTKQTRINLHKYDVDINGNDKHKAECYNKKSNNICSSFQKQLNDNHAGIVYRINQSTIENENCFAHDSISIPMTATTGVLYGPKIKSDYGFEASQKKHNNIFGDDTEYMGKTYCRYEVNDSSSKNKSSTFQPSIDEHQNPNMVKLFNYDMYSKWPQFIHISSFNRQPQKHNYMAELFSKVQNTNHHSAFVQRKEGISLLSKQFDQQRYQNERDYVKEKLDVAASKRNAIKNKRSREQSELAMLESLNVLRHENDDSRQKYSSIHYLFDKNGKNNNNLRLMSKIDKEYFASASRGNDRYPWEENESMLAW